MPHITAHSLLRIAVCGGILLYVLPSLVACVRRARHLQAIFTVNLLLGWTGVAWLDSLQWAWHSGDSVSRSESGFFSPFEVFEDEPDPVMQEEHRRAA